MKTPKEVAEYVAELKASYEADISKLQSDGNNHWLRRLAQNTLIRIEMLEWVLR